MSTPGFRFSWPAEPEKVWCVRCELVKCYLPCNVCTLCLLLDEVMREGET